MPRKPSFIEGNRLVDLLVKNPSAAVSGLSSMIVSASIDSVGTGKDIYETLSSKLKNLSDEEVDFIAQQIFCHVAADDSDISALNSQLKDIRSSPQSYPFEYLTEISITDKKGLVNLMGITAEREKLEWGTFLKSYLEENRAPLNGKAIIYDILDPNIALNQGWVTHRTAKSVRLHKYEAYKADYNGSHHYHPGIWPKKDTLNYYNNIRDKSVTYPNTLGIITFNRELEPGVIEPEIIGYNKQFFYIPDTPEKDHLVRANPKDIIAYLQKDSL